MKGLILVLSLLLGASSLALAGDFAFRAGDQLTVKVSGLSVDDNQALSGKFEIDGRGFLTLPHLAELEAAGHSEGQLQMDIQRSYRAQPPYAKAVVLVNPGPFVDVRGAAHPSLYHGDGSCRVEFVSGLTVQGAITAAGGLPSGDVHLSAIILVRQGKEVSRAKTLADQKKLLAVPLQAGDSVWISQTFW